MITEWPRLDFSAHFFVNGLPLVLNLHHMEQRLLDKRITTNERLQVDSDLADKDLPRFVTVAAHDDDDPLLFRFVVAGDNVYEMYADSPGKYQGWRLHMDPVKRHMSVVDSSTDALFSLIGKEGVRLGLDDLSVGSLSVVLVSEERKSGIYLTTTNYRDKRPDIKRPAVKKIIVDVNPNFTGHDAFNGEVAKFVLKVVKQPEWDDGDDWFLAG
jgi:hypothetical protein